jgi:3-phenylpropionate/cinnamic acid dioxygenase small subunit
MLKDRVMGVTRTQMFAPRYYRRFPGPLRIMGADGDGVRTRHNLLVVQTLLDKQTEIVLSADCRDVVVRDADRLRLRERVVVFDSEMVPNSLIYPA